MGLRKGQKELVELYREGYCAVPAIPGGGKTHSLTQWAVEMISSQHCNNGKILIVTYMNTAVNNFKQRISNELDKRGIVGKKSYLVSTIHGLCLQIIKDKPDKIIANEEFEIIDPVAKVHLIERALDEWKKDNEDRFTYFISDEQLNSAKRADTYQKWQKNFKRIVESGISDIKSRGLNFVAAKELTSKLNKNSLLKAVSEIYSLYDKKLKASGCLDFDDMLYNAKKILEEDEELLERYRKKYSFVCEDEAQDSNLIQSEILELIANGNLLRVGDSNQAICGSFSNSEYTLFKDFCNDSRTTNYKITQSSRNTKEIIDLANYFVKYVIEEHPVEECKSSLVPQFIETVELDDPFKNPTTEEYGIKTRIFNKWEEEVAGVVAQASYMQNKYPDKTIAILIPTAWRINSVVALLEEKGIAFEQLDNTSSEKNKTVRLLGRVIDFIASPQNSRKLADMVEECFSIDVSLEEEKKIIKNEQKLLRNFIESYSTEKLIYPLTGEINFSDVPDELQNTQVWKFFISKLDLIKELLEFPTIVIEKLILYISEKFNFGREERAIAQKVANDVRYLMGQNPRWRLSDLATELLSTKNMFNYFAGVVWDLQGYEAKPGVITVSTYHKSKGLEWDIVFLMCLNNSDFPVTLEDKFMGEYWFLKETFKNPLAVIKGEVKNVLDNKETGDLQKEMKLEIISEKSRLLYVGITRAREHLFLSAFEANRGRKNEVLPSTYLAKIKEFVDREASTWKKI